MSTFDPNKLDIDFDNLDKPMEDESLLEPSQASQEAWKAEADQTTTLLDPLADVVEEKTPNTVPVEKNTVSIEQEEVEPKDSMLEEILESDTTQNITSESQKTIYDINITQVDDLMSKLVQNGYDFVTLEPQESYVEVIFRKNSTIVESKNIRYSTYSNLLIKIKTLGKISIENSQEPAQWWTELKFQKRWYKIGIKTVPDVRGEKVFF